MTEAMHRRRVISGLLLLQLGCGPTVSNTEDSGTQTQTETTADTGGTTMDPGQADTTVVESTGNIPPPADSSGDGTSTGGPPDVACMDSRYDYASIRLESEVRFAFQNICTVEQFSAGLDVVVMDLLCEGIERRLAGGGENFEDYFVVGDVIELIAAGDPDAWQHVVIFDDRGNFVMGTHDIADAAPDFTNWFLSIGFEVVDTACEDELTGSDCTYHRVALDLTLEGQTQRAHDGSFVQLSGVRVYSDARLFDPGSDRCTVGPFGHFSVYSTR